MNGFRPPNYSPGYNQALMDDPMALTFMMLGGPMLQQAMGPQHFIPHLTPSQALSDQFMASRYQRDQLQAAGAASQQGNAAVAGRILGLRALVTDAPATDLNREQANQLAAVANHPISKALLASAVGPENLEAVMFGRKGDPSALANASNKINFFRRDTTGGTRMSGQSMQEFSQNLYENLYGASADVDDMHGFMAGQTGTVMENLFQRGQLPKSMGEMTAADRVRLMSNTQRDDATVTRLARQFGHNEMMQQESYANATEEERKQMLDRNLGTYKGRIENTFREVDRFNAGDPRARGASEIEQMDGYGMAARNVDSQRVSKVVKEYTGALDAIRDIFGDNGQGNAPVEALIEALDQFSSGSIDRIDPKKVEKTMRDMRGALQAGGVNLESFAQIAAQGSGLAQMYGTPAHMQMQANAQTVNQLAAMQQTGKFSRKIYGDMTEAEAMQDAQSRIYRAQQSEAGKSMAALNRMYQQNKEMYAGTELEAAMQAYNDPNSNGEYNFGGERRNLAEAVATRGRGGALDILRSSGGNTQTFDAFFHDPGTAEKYSTGLELTAQRKELTRDLSNRVINGELVGRMRGERFEQLRSRGVLGMGGQSEEEFERERNDMASALSRGFAQVIMDETGGMTSEERAAHLESRHVDMMSQYYESRGYGRREARTRAETASRAMFGETEAQRRESLSGMAAQSNTYVASQTGHQISAEDQISGTDVQQRVNENEARFADQAEREQRVARGQKSSILQRSGEVLEKMGQDPNYSGKDAAKDLLNAQNITEMRNKYAPEMTESIGATLDMYRNARTDADRSRADTIMAGLYEGRNTAARDAAISALSEQAFGSATGENADALRRTIVDGGNVDDLAQRMPRRQREALLAQARGLQLARRADLAGAGFGQTAAEAVAEADQLRTVGGDTEPAAAVEQATAFHRADRLLSAETAERLVQANDDEENGALLGGAASTAFNALNTAVSLAGVYDNASQGYAALNGEEINTGQVAFSSAQAAVGLAENAVSGANWASRFSKIAPAAGKVSRVLGPVSRLAPVLGPALGFAAGAFEGAGNGRGAIEGGILGMLTGDASSGSMMSGFLGVEEGSTTDKTLGVFGAAVNGALTGGTAGAMAGAGFFSLPAAAVGAIGGAALGAGAEMYKLFTEPAGQQDVAQATVGTAAVQQTVDNTPRQTTAQAGMAGNGNGTGEITVNGTLSLRGLQEVILQATGNRPMETPDGGVPVLGT